MATTPDLLTSTATTPRVLHPVPQADGTMVYGHNLTSKNKIDPVELRVGIVNALPIVFVPGVMGSNLQSLDEYHSEVWRLDLNPFLGQPVGLLWGKVGQSAGERQKLLHPARTEVDARGSVPSRGVGSILVSNGKKELEAIYRGRGWGEVGEGSYQSFLMFLEDTLNGHRKEPLEITGVEAKIAKLMAMRAQDPLNQPWRPEKGPATSESSDFVNLRKWLFPVYACGYNWLDDNATGAAQYLQTRIRQAIEQNNSATSRCDQVIVITHSMGGLVARACQQLEDMQGLIAGVVHGVMPADGAPVAYRRCKLGVIEEQFGAGLVIGKTGQEVTAIFAQAPGTLQLLPTHRYKPGWLEVRDPDGKTVQKVLHEVDPYAEIYKKRDRWWALIKEEWLAPKDGKPIEWSEYLKFITMAEALHKLILLPSAYHPNTYAFYGADNRGMTRSFERIVWQMTRGANAEKALTVDQVYGMGANDEQMKLDGVNPEQVGVREIIVRKRTRDADTFGIEEVSQWEIRANLADGNGDGTVPAQSGRGPVDSAKVKQVFRLTGVEHEPAFSDKSPIARQVTLYAISKIALEASVPKPKSQNSAAARG